MTNFSFSTTGLELEDVDRLFATRGRAESSALWDAPIHDKSVDSSNNSDHLGKGGVVTQREIAEQKV
jgi:hypothetical protein